MNTGEVAKRLESVDPYTVLVVRLATADGGFFELPIERVDYIPVKDGDDAYLALVPFQNLAAK